MDVFCAADVHAGAHQAARDALHRRAGMSHTPNLASNLNDINEISNCSHKLTRTVTIGSALHHKPGGVQVSSNSAAFALYFLFDTGRKTSRNPNTSG